ncbi:hypothetical protein ACYSM9_12475 [Arthrobacter sp. C152]
MSGNLELCSLWSAHEQARGKLRRSLLEAGARQRRLRFISYVALAALAVATIGVVLMAVER